MGSVGFRIGGHRGMGKNLPASLGEASSDAKAPYRPKVRENTILSLTQAADAGADFVEFDVQVTKDGHAILFHDNLIWTRTGSGDEKGTRIPDMDLGEFQQINAESIKKGKLLRKLTDGNSHVWLEEEEGEMPALEEVFEGVPVPLGLNLELKFPADDSVDVSDADVAHMLDHVIPVVKSSLARQSREVFFSSFVPKAVLELKRREPSFQVFFLTCGVPGKFKDEQMNSIQAALEVARSGSLQGIVAEVDALLQEESALELAKTLGLQVFTWGDSNNNTSTIQQQMDKGVDGAIVDDIKTAVQARSSKNSC